MGEEREWLSVSEYWEGEFCGWALEVEMGRWWLCLFVCVYICRCVYVCIHIYDCVCIYIHVCVSVCLNMKWGSGSLCVSMYGHVWVYIYI